MKMTGDGFAGYKKPFAPIDIVAMLEEEAFMILHSGEIPEIAYHGAVYYLTEDPDGPGLSMEDIGENGLMHLKTAVVDRYRLIILRDMDPANRDKRIYRGLQRALINWERLKAFALRVPMDIGSIKREIAAALKSFLARESSDVSSGARPTSINCTLDVLLDFAADLGLADPDVLDYIKKLSPFLVCADASSESLCCCGP
ncbi:uL29 family ribosomal protein [Dissulfurimicrobium hydrothermale]|uniref:hypothetical protein n=1 Tax=Dissulfurimicrobium hydrothermale TaxID=1750598 RepID=UPI001EDAD925|nr:hypothetical protein [Dissulfurimicrobium hydrothermale]UKL14541.1 hypothetical protein LGS26_04745 [Dissulfurimicrobium hydrothermale]